MKEANKIATLIKEQTEIDIFENKRTRPHAEYRSLLCFILRNQFNMTLHQIKDYFIAKGKNYDHATAMHSLNNFEMYKKYNPDIENLLVYITKKHPNNIKGNKGNNLKRVILSHKINHLKDKYVDSLLTIVEKLPVKQDEK
tara:strand:+ start:336 stop:758 length:423 start_codon:yes stop_codon:yes gene_type:complete